MKKGIFAIFTVLAILAMVMTGCPDGGGGGKNGDNGGDDVTITFDQNYPGAPKATTVKVGKDTELGAKLPTTTPTRTGTATEAWNFVAWNAKADGTGAAITANSKFSADTTVYAKWSSYNPNTTAVVTFNKNYTNAPAAETKTVTKGASLGSNMPANPTRTDNFDFDAWNTKADGTGTTFIGSTTVADDITVYAKWIDKNTPKIKISFNVNYPASKPDAPDFVIPDAEIYQGATIGDKLYEMPEAPAGGSTFLELGLLFRGWYKNAEGTGDAVTEATVFNVASTIYAKWEAFDPTTQFPITFDYNYDQNDNSTEGDPPAVIIITGTDGTIGDKWPEDPTRVGNTPGADTENDTWVFKGWKQFASGSGDTFTDATVFTEVRTIFVAWEPSTGWAPDIAPDGTDLARAEMVCLANAQFAIYRFDIPDGKTIADYGNLKVSYMIGPGAVNKVNGARAIRFLGNYKDSDFTYYNIPANKTYAAGQKYSQDDTAWTGEVMNANYNGGKNAPYILTTLASWKTIAEAAQGLGIKIVPYEWFTLEYKIDGSGPGKDNSYNSDNLPSKYPNGPITFGIGIPDNNNGGNLHYIRDVTLLGADANTTSIIAKPVWYKITETVDGEDVEKIIPAFAGYNTTDGTNGTKELYRRMCDGSQPTPFEKTP